MCVLFVVLKSRNSMYMSDEQVRFLCSLTIKETHMHQCLCTARSKQNVPVKFVLQVHVYC